jgi:hypothetical protein
VLALGKVSVSRLVSVRVAFFCRGSQQHSENILPSVRRKTLGNVFFADIYFAVLTLPSVTLGKAFAECFIAFAVCLRH